MYLAGGQFHRRRRFTSPTLIPPRHPQIHKEIQRVDPRQNPVEVIEPALVEIFPQPPLPHSTAASHNHLHGGGAQPAPDPDLAQKHGAADAPRPFRRLVVEKLQLPHVRENLRRPDQKALREKPEHADPRTAGAFSPASPLHRGGGNHGEDRHEQTRAYTLQRGDATWVAGPRPEKRDGELLVDGDYY
ncbi:hypothetical protein ABFS82_03G064600 [Erythranthe guttata]